MRRILRKWIPALGGPEVDQVELELTRHALKRLRLEGTALRNEATVNLRGALWDDWVAREMKWSARTIDELRKVDDGAAEWFVSIRLQGESRVEAPFCSGSSPDYIAIHTIRLQRLNEIMFEMWGD